MHVPVPVRALRIHVCHKNQPEAACHALHMMAGCDSHSQAWKLWRLRRREVVALCS